MIKLQREMPQDYNLFLFGDDHEGVTLRDQELWGKLIDMMHQKIEGCKANFGVDHGDIVEAIAIDDPRFDGLTTEGKVLNQIQQAIKNREAIKNKLIGICEGNHPLKLWRFGRITEHICNELKVPYLSWSAVLDYTYKKQTVFRHYCAHGFKAINSSMPDLHDRRLAMERSLRRQLQYKAHNCYLMSIGHSHRLIISEPQFLYDPETGHRIESTNFSEKYVPPKDRWFVNTGSFYKSMGNGISGYAEIKGYDPMRTGFALAIVRNKKIIEIRKIFA